MRIKCLAATAWKLEFLVAVKNTNLILAAEDVVVAGLYGSLSAINQPIRIVRKVPNAVATREGHSGARSQMLRYINGRKIGDVRFIPQRPAT